MCASVSPNAVAMRALGPIMCQPSSVLDVTTYTKLMSMNHIGDITAMALQFAVTCGIILPLGSVYSAVGSMYVGLHAQQTVTMI